MPWEKQENSRLSLQVMRALPAAGLAGLLAGGQVSEGVLAKRLEWCRGWTRDVAAQDTDPQCQMLAAGCQSLQVCINAGIVLCRRACLIAGRG